MPSKLAAQRIEAQVAIMKSQPGQWELIGEQVPNGRARPYVLRGCDVIYRNQHTPGRSDILVCWPE